MAKGCIGHHGKKASRRAGVGHVSGHDLRKFFDSHMKSAIEDAVPVDWRMGHSLDKIRRNYGILHREK